MNTKIVVDTSVWIEFFRNSESSLSRHLSTLLRERRVVMVGLVLAEILQGIKAQKEAKAVKESLSKLPYLEITKSVWEIAGDLSAALRKKGITIPLSDLVIAAAALSTDHEVFTVDPHFKKVPGLKLHTTLYQ
ncbi:MAG: PIN domain-containing protein [Syntrophales bacterium LBB04]|nr:PIN domain-containing protein [Syntrophales bacterium LBB04]